MMSGTVGWFIRNEHGVVCGRAWIPEGTKYFAMVSRFNEFGWDIPNTHTVDMNQDCNRRNPEYWPKHWSFGKPNMSDKGSPMGTEGGE